MEAPEAVVGYGEMAEAGRSCSGEEGAFAAVPETGSDTAPADTVRGIAVLQVHLSAADPVVDPEVETLSSRRHSASAASPPTSAAVHAAHSPVVQTVVAVVAGLNPHFPSDYGARPAIVQTVAVARYISVGSRAVDTGDMHLYSARGSLGAGPLAAQSSSRQDCA